jgi:hypothetical protein
MKKLWDAVGGLSTPSKMPGYAYGIPAWKCKLGAILRKKAGSVCHKCYALKGMYVFPVVQNAQRRRLKSLSRPEWAENMVELLSRKYARKAKRDRVFRWHDSGDLQSVSHLAKIVDIARRLPRIRFWLPTRERTMVREYLRENQQGFPANLVVRLSVPMIGQIPARGFAPAGVLTSTVGVAYGRECPAPKQGNACGNCRSCWDPKVGNVSYKKH